MIKNHLSKLLGERKMSQSDLARRTGIRRQLISDIYHEINININVNHLDKLCEVLECDVCDLITYLPSPKTRKTGEQ